PVSADSQYTITDLGTLGGTFSGARAINDNMQIVGGSDTSTGERHAFLWENGVMTDLGTLGGNFSFAVAINNFGQVVGLSDTASGDLHSFLWESGAMTDLGTLGGSFTYVHSINELGQVVGFSHIASGVNHAFLWENGVMTDLGTLGGSFSHAWSINELGQVVGISAFDDSIHAFLWQNGVMTDLGILAGGNSSYAYGINENQQIVGWGDIMSSNEGHAVLWESGTITDLGVLRDTDTFSQALSINDQMQIVGSSGDIEDWDGEAYHAFLWEDGSMIDLGTLGGDFATAYGINSDGQIVGDSSTSSGENHAVLWALPDTKVNITIDIKPVSQTNPINLESKGVIPVAVLTTDDFDASTIDPATVVFADAFPLRWSWQDIDWDGDIDLLFFFKTQELQLDVNSTMAIFVGETFDGLSIEGMDSVRIVPQSKP
ncbi:MAG TPA: hypothetical protein VLA72_06880, partial [Anaerolineales bacterium]|nr:hypothetical protein [Anaerolineales bacterium]